LPTESVDVTNDACPPDTATGGCAAPSIVKVTVPVAVEGVMVAVNVTGCPTALGLGEAVKEVVVDPGVIAVVKDELLLLGLGSADSVDTVAVLVLLGAAASVELTTSVNCALVPATMMLLHVIDPLFPTGGVLQEADGPVFWVSD
jgi:hypothetical protein